MPYHRRWRRGCKACAIAIPGWLSSLVSLASRAPDPAAGVAAPSDPRSGRERKRTGRPCCTRSDLRRGVPGSTGPHHGHRPPGRHRPRRRSTRSGSGSLDAADLMRQLVYLPNASLLVAEVRREIAGGALLVLRPSVVAGGYVGTIDLLVVAPGPRRGPRDGRAPGGAPPVREQQGLLDRSRPPQPSDPADLARLERAGFAPPGQRSGGPSRRPVRPPAEPSAPGGRKAGPPHHIGVTCGQERRRLRGRGEHLLRGQGGRRGHRLRHAAEVGHRRTRLRPRVRLHRARPGQREPAQLPPVPRAPPVQGRQQGHPQVRRRQGQGEPRHRARRRPDEDRPQPRHRRHRVGRRRLRLGDPRRPGDGRPRARSSASAATRRRT